MASRLKILSHFDTLFDVDYGILKTVFEKFGNSKYLNDDYLKKVSFQDLQKDLKSQEVRDPLKIIFKPEFEISEDFYNQINEAYGEDIVFNSLPLKTFNMFSALEAYDMISSIYVICKNGWEENKILEDTDYKVFTEPIDFDTLHVRDYRDVKNYNNLRGKNIYIANCKYNLELSKYPDIIIPNLELSEECLFNDIKLIDIY